MNLDLFFNGTFKQNIKKFKEDLKTYTISKGLKLPEPFNILKIDPNNIGNNILFINPPLRTPKLFSSKEDQLLEVLCKEYDIGRKAITYCYLFPDEHINKNLVKEFSPWIKRLTDLVQPKLIVCLGEDAQCSYFKNKFLIRESHGTQIGNYDGAPILTVFPIDYFTNRTGFEDSTYKNHIQKHDWDFIKSQYQKYIGEKDENL